MLHIDSSVMKDMDTTRSYGISDTVGRGNMRDTSHILNTHSICHLIADTDCRSMLTLHYWDY